MNLSRQHFLYFELIWSLVWINDFLMLLLVAADGQNDIPLKNKQQKINKCLQNIVIFPLLAT